MYSYTYIHIYIYIHEMVILWWINSSLQDFQTDTIHAMQFVIKIVPFLLPLAWSTAWICDPNSNSS